MRLPSLENATDQTPEVWPSSTFSVSPVNESHTRTELSPEPETMRLPSLENATDLTSEVRPSSTFSVLPMDESHTRIDLSQEPETMRLSSLENATVSTSLPTLRVINGMPPCS